MRCPGEPRARVGCRRRPTGLGGSGPLPLPATAPRTTRRRHCCEAARFHPWSYDLKEKPKPQTARTHKCCPEV
eukprot:3463084-Pyramimonas_sp.AAC.1